VLPKFEVFWHGTPCSPVTAHQSTHSKIPGHLNPSSLNFVKFMEFTIHRRM